MSYIGKNVAPQPQGTYSQSEIDTQMLTKSPTDSPTFTGTPKAPTASTGDNSTKIATTEFVNSEITNDVGVANSSLVKTALNASGSAPIYACRAWVNFNGTNTVAIRASGNVSSITDNGVGSYTVNFTTAMQDANYSATAHCTYIQQVTHRIHAVVGGADAGQVLTTSLAMETRRTDDNSNQDIKYVHVVIFR